MKTPFTAQAFSLRNGKTGIIREADSPDAKELLGFLNQIATESSMISFGAGEFELTETEEAEFLRTCRASGNQIYLLALVDEQLAGTIHLAAGKRARVRHSGEFGLSVRKSYWGQGVGSALLDALLDWAKQTGIIKKINLRVREDNDRAIALYKRKGFIQEGRLSNEMLVEGKFYDLLAMGLNLST